MMLAVTDGLAEIRRAIAMGQALPGERLPPARDLAAVPRMNRNTISRALRLLRDEGLPEFRRGHGTTVACLRGLAGRDGWLQTCVVGQLRGDR
jgi:DNA-binding GntR family transcriptional regulator